MGLTNKQAAELERLADQRREYEQKLEDVYNLQLDIEHELYMIEREIEDVINHG